MHSWRMGIGEKSTRSKPGLQMVSLHYIHSVRGMRTRHASLLTITVKLKWTLILGYPLAGVTVVQMMGPIYDLCNPARILAYGGTAGAIWTIRLLEVRTCKEANPNKLFRIAAPPCACPHIGAAIWEPMTIVNERD